LAEENTLHLTLAMSLPLNDLPENRTRSELWRRQWLPQKKLSLLLGVNQSVRKAAADCLRWFEPYQELLWWEPTDPDGKKLLDKEGRPIKRTAGHMRVLRKLEEIAPFRGYQLGSAVKNGLRHKVADLLLSYAKRKLDPQFTDKTSYPSIGDQFPIVWTGAFVCYEQSITGQLYLYLPLFPRGSHQEDITNNYDPDRGPALQVFGEKEIARLSRSTSGLLLPLQFDKWGEATFIRGENNPPTWKATHRRSDKKWLSEVLLREKDFQPKRVELLVRNGRIFVNVACEIPTKPLLEVENFMGVSFGLEHLVTVVVINRDGNVVHQRQEPARRYEKTYFARLERLRRRGGPFSQELETFHYRQVAQIVEEALRFKSVPAVEQVGNIPKGRYNPRLNLRLSYWPFGKLADLTSYKAVKEGLPKPYSVYSATAKMLCSTCGAANKEGDQPISLKGPTVYCGNCGTRHNTGFNTALNLARRAQELFVKGVVAR